MLLKDLIFKKFIFIFTICFLLIILLITLAFYINFKLGNDKNTKFIESYVLDVSKMAIFNDNLLHIQSDLNKIGKIYSAGVEDVHLKVYIDERLIASYGMKSDSSFTTKTKRSDSLNSTNIEIVVQINHRTTVMLYITTLLLTLLLSVCSYFLIRRNMKLTSEAVTLPLTEFKDQIAKLSLNLSSASGNNLDLSYSHIKEIRELSNAINIFVYKIHTLRQQLELEARDKVFKDLAKQVAHDIRSPVGALRIAIENIGDVDPKVKSLIVNAANRINMIAEDLLSSGRSGQTEKIFDIVDAAEEIVSEKMNQYPAVEILLTASAKIILNSKVIAKVDIQRILSNLINNAIEAQSPGRKLNINIKIEEVENYVTIKIEDNGKGIPSHILSKIGEANFSFGKLTGNGLGIGGAKELLKKSNSRLEINSIENQKTVVTVILNKL